MRTTRTIVAIRHVQHTINGEDNRNVCVLPEGHHRFFGERKSHLRIVSLLEQPLVKR
jgi:hypothetical protein